MHGRSLSLHSPETHDEGGHGAIRNHQQLVNAARDVISSLPATFEPKPDDILLDAMCRIIQYFVSVCRPRSPLQEYRSRSAVIVANNTRPQVFPCNDDNT